MADSRYVRRHGWPIPIVLVLAFATPVAEAKPKLPKPPKLPAPTKLAYHPIGSPPLSDKKAKKYVQRSSWEPRPNNWKPNHTVPKRKQLRRFRRKSDMPYKQYVTGRFKGTTDEILQWGARKWGFEPDLFRAVAIVESWWNMSTRGDNGDSFGLMQVRRPYHCCLPFMRTSTAFNVDYYGGILSAYYHGKQSWLNTVERGAFYRAGDLWGSVGVWASGRWHLGTSPWYVGMVQKRLREQTWRTHPWF